MKGTRMLVFLPKSRVIVEFWIGVRDRRVWKTTSRQFRKVRQDNCQLQIFIGFRKMLV